MDDAGKDLLSVVGRATQAKCVFFVDDEPKVCRAVARILERIGLKVRHFTGAVDCLKQVSRHPPDLIITDLRMPQMDGVELLTRVKRDMPALPVLMLTGFGDIPTAVRAVKAGAYDFIEKPFSGETLVSAVKSGLGQRMRFKRLKRKRLTTTEMVVLRLIMQGKSSREIARLRSRSIRTVEWHRHNIMRKLGVDNTVDLVRQAISLGFGGKMPKGR